MKLLLLAVVLLISGCQEKQKNRGNSRYVMEEPVDLEADRAQGEKPEKEKIKPKRIKRKILYNRTTKDVPAFTEPSKTSEIKDYIRPDANVTVTGSLIVKGQKWYHGKVGWVVKGSLAELNVAKLRRILYNRTKKDVPAFTEPSKTSEIKDYIRPDANVTVTGSLIVKAQEWYHGSVGWVVKGSLAEFNIVKFRRLLKSNIPIGQFYNASQAQREKAVKAFESGSEYDVVMNSIFRNVKYIDIDPGYLDIALMRGAHDAREFGFNGIMRELTKVAAGKFKLVCYGKYWYPKMFSAFTDATEFYSRKMPHKNRTDYLFTITLEVLNKNAIRFKGKVYRRLKDQ